MERNVKLRLRIDFKAMKYFNMYNLKYRKKFIWFYIGMIILCIGLGTITVIQGQTILGIVFGLFAVYLIYQTLRMENMIDRQIANYFYNIRPIEQVIEITDELIRISSPTDPTRVSEYDWLTITAIHEIPQYFYLFINKQPLIVDKDANMMLEGNHQDLFDIILEKAQGKPYKKIEAEIVKNPITFVHQEFAEEENDAQEVEVSDIQTVDTELDEDVQEIPVEVEDENNKEEV